MLTINVKLVSVLAPPAPHPFLAAHACNPPFSSAANASAHAKLATMQMQQPEYASPADIPAKVVSTPPHYAPAALSDISVAQPVSSPVLQDTSPISQLSHASNVYLPAFNAKSSGLNAQNAQAIYICKPIALVSVPVMPAMLPPMGFVRNVDTHASHAAIQLPTAVLVKQVIFLSTLVSAYAPILFTVTMRPESAKSANPHVSNAQPLSNAFRALRTTATTRPIQLVSPIVRLQPTA